MPRRSDVLLALALAAVGVGGLIGEHLDPSAGITREWDALGIALALVMTLPVAFRRRYPIGVLVVSGVALLVAADRGYGIGLAQLGTVAALASAAYFTNRRVTIRIAVIVAGVLTVTILSAIPTDTDVSVSESVATVLSAELAIFVGDLLREMRESQRRLGELALAEDRMRIAREVHDVVGHSLVGIALQARAARRRLDRDPAKALAAIDEIDALAASALAETRRAVGVIRAGEPEMAPQPTLDGLDELVGRLEADDVHVRLEREAADGVPVLVQSTAFRIVQEALSNVVKHARPASAVVTVRRAGDALAVEVRDDGAAARVANGGGHGLQGMRERAELCGGTLEAGPAPEGGWLVSARLPIHP
jgi:signal transduction histidine kinase